MNSDYDTRWLKYEGRISIHVGADDCGGECPDRDDDSGDTFANGSSRVQDLTKLLGMVVRRAAGNGAHGPEGIGDVRHYEGRRLRSGFGRYYQNDELKAVTSGGDYAQVRNGHRGNGSG
jgi:hypothetical protein